MDAVTGKETRNFYSLQDDVQFGSQAYEETLAEVRTQGIPVNANAARTAQLREMVRRIGAVSDLPDLPYEVALIHTNVVNAMAAPGGKIMVYEGLWDPQNGLVQDDDELAAVLAHEIAHVNCRHSTEAMTRALPGNMLAAASVIATQKTKYEQLGQTMAAAGMFIHNGLWMTHYSRNDEIEADRVGMMYMAKAGYDPRAAARIWERAAARRNGADSVVGIFSTHPADNVRLQNLRDHLPAAMDLYQQTLAGR
jgi:predicted Zn-dependent protease